MKTYDFGVAALFLMLALMTGHSEYEKSQMEQETPAEQTQPSETPEPV